MANFVQNNAVLWCIKNYHFSFPLARRHILSHFHCENLVRLLEVNPTKLWGPLYESGPLEIPTLRILYTEPPIFFQLQFQFSYPDTAFWGSSSSGFLLW